MNENILQQRAVWGSERREILEQTPDLAEAGDREQLDVDPNTGPSVNQVKARVRRAEMEQSLGSWGVGLVIFGVIHIVLSSVFEPGWGIVLIVIGLLAFASRSRVMFLIIGFALWLAAMGNLTGGYGSWSMFGLLQIYWGFKEIVKFFKYSDVT